MGGALLQLSSLGSADAFLNQDPDVTYWKSNYRRATPHATEAIEMQATGAVDFGGKAAVSISRTGDLLHKVWLEITLPDLRDYYTSPVVASALQPRITRAYKASSSTVHVRIEAPVSGTYPVVAIRNEVGEVLAIGEFVSGVADISFEYTESTNLVLTAIAVVTNDVEGFLAADMGSVALFLEGAEQSASPVRQAIYLRYTNAVGLALMESIEWEIGGSRVDRIPDAEFLDLYSELTVSESKRSGFNEMVGRKDAWTLEEADYAERTYYVEAPFSFSKDTTGSVPLVALTYHETRVNLTFKNVLDLVRSDIPISSLVSADGLPPSFVDGRVYADVVFLDTFERRRFAQIPHEQLIEQVQYIGDTVITPAQVGQIRKVQLDGFSHPVKELFFVYQPFGKYQRDAVNGNDFFVYNTATNGDPIADVRLVLNGQERFTPRPMQYFYQVQPYQHHTRLPTKKVCVYSFAIYPEDSKAPSGSCNFGRLDNAGLYFRVTDSLDNTGGRLKVYALSWNVLRIAEGMAQVAFAS